MKSWPKISFIIPVHNRAKMVLEALESLRNQTVPDWEAIVVDDHSTDSLEAVVKDFDRRACYLALSDNFGRGAACARNLGNREARADLIAVLDSDDLAKPERAERAIASYQKHQWDFYCARRELVGQMRGALTEHTVNPTRWDSELFKKQSFVTHSTVVYTKKTVLEIPYNSAFSPLSDYDLISRFITAGRRMFFDPFVTAVYRRHGGVTLTTHTPMAHRKKLLHYIRKLRGWE